MALKDQIDNDLKQALKDKKELELSVLRMLKTALKNAEIAAKGSLSEEDAAKVVATQAKQRKDAISQFEQGGRSDLADKEKAELAVLQTYLPEQMPEEDIRKVIREKISEAGDDQNFGRIMGMVMKEIGQKADGGAVRQILQEELGENG